MGKITTKKFKDHEDWLNLRKNSIGGSDAPAITGISRYSSPYNVWNDKIGKASPIPVNEAMRQGTDLEDYVARRFSEKTGKKVHRRNVTIFNSDYPYSHANVDRWVTGEKAGLECKTTKSLNLKRFKNGEFPPEYYIQILHYMAVTGAEKYYLAVLVFGTDFYVFEIERDQEAIDNLMEIERDFWENNVLTETPPEVDGLQSTTDALNVFFDKPEESEADLFGLEEEALRLNDLKLQKKELEKEIRRSEQTIQERMGNCTVGETQGFRFSWKNENRSTFLKNKLFEDHPEIDFSPYTVQIPTKNRVFRMKEIKD